MHDYARSVANAKHKRTKKSSKQKLPLGLLALTVLACGGLGGGIYYLSQVELPALSTHADSAQQPAPRVVEKSIAADEPDEETESRFGFYKILPEAQVISSGEEAYKLPPNKQKLSQYMLQAGSFRNQRDADRLRAKLILEGLNAKVQATRSKQGSTWHRIMVGPFKNRRELNQAQDTLARNNTEFMLVQVR